MAKRPLMMAARSNLSVYLRDIQATKLLRPVEEKALAKRIRQGDRVARDRLVRANLRLVVSIARSYRRCGMELDDLIEAGNVGLLAATDRFDPDRNVHFATYARFWIKLEIHNALSNTARPIRIPVYLVHMIRRWRFVVAAMLEESGKLPTDDEVCVRMKLTTTQRRRLFEGLRFVRTPSFSELADDMDVEQNFADASVAAPEAMATRDESLEKLSRMLERIDQKEAGVLRRRFGLHGRQPQTYRAIGAEMGLGCKRVRRMEQRGLRRLRTLLASIA